MKSHHPQTKPADHRGTLLPLVLVVIVMPDSRWLRVYRANADGVGIHRYV